MRISSLAVLLFAPMLAPAGSYPLSGEEWASPRSGAGVLGWPAVQAAVAEWRAAQGQVIVIQHAHDEEAALRASELHDWLIALGLPPAALHTRVGATGSAALLLHVEPQPAAPVPAGAQR